YAGNGSSGYAGDGGLATSASLGYPSGLAFDSSGNLYIADGNKLIRRIDRATNIISTFAGNGVAGFSGDWGPATSGSLSGPVAVAFDTRGNLLIADYENRRVRRVTPSGIISTLAGGSDGKPIDGIPATDAALYLPGRISIDSAGHMYIAD